MNGKVQTVCIGNPKRLLSGSYFISNVLGKPCFQLNVFLFHIFLVHSLILFYQLIVYFQGLSTASDEFPEITIKLNNYYSRYE